ncbi:MAG TPA: capsule assembly Wzi family protein, partial [Longimicrobiales bacterium]
PASPPDAAAPPAAAPAAERAGDAGGGIFALSAGYARMVGRVATGVGYLDWSGTHPIPDTSAAFLAPELALGAGAHLSLHGEPLLRSNGVGLKDADLVAVLGPIGAWAGRRTVRFGPGEWGGIVLGDRVPLDGFGGFLAEPIHFPWLLRAMGPIQIESFFSKTYGGDTIRDPFFVAFRGTMSPAARLTIGLNRAAMFAGRGNEPITLRNMAFLFIGGTGRHGTANTGSFANDVLSADVSWRPPLERWLPVVTYLEWGMDDGSGMWHRAPGIVAGVRDDAVPGLPWLSLGIERTSFPVSGKINTMWYRDWSLRNGWADAGVPVGHPLGGEGTELLGTVGATLLDARLRLSAHGYRRHRGNQNLFAPERMGVSHGGSLRLEGRLGPELDLLLDGEAERGAGGAWSTSRLSSALRWMH